MNREWTPALIQAISAAIVRGTGWNLGFDFECEIVAVLQALAVALDLHDRLGDNRAIRARNPSRPAERFR
jgi:hypothetical protein